MQIELRGLEQVQQSLGINIPRQIRFATMKAINETAIAVQEHEIRDQLPSKLILRSRGSPWWKPGSRFGINIKFANKETLVATVGSMADWLKLQEYGGTKSGHGHRLAIEAGARPNETAVLTPALKPRALLRQAGQTYISRGKSRTARKGGKGFIIETKSGPAIFIREGNKLRLMYILASSARISAKLGFAESGREKVNEVYQANFTKHFKNAIATAKAA